MPCRCFPCCERAGDAVGDGGRSLLQGAAASRLAQPTPSAWRANVFLLLLFSQKQHQQSVSLLSIPPRRASSWKFKHSGAGSFGRATSWGHLRAGEASGRKQSSSFTSTEALELSLAGLIQEAAQSGALWLQAWIAKLALFCLFVFKCQVQSEAPTLQFT